MLKNIASSSTLQTSDDPDKSLFLATESVFIQALNNLKPQAIFQQNPLFVFESSQKVFEKYPQILPHIQFLISTLTPGPVEFIIAKNTHIYIPNQKESLEFVAKSGSNLEAFYPKINNLFYPTTVKMLDSLSYKKKLIVGSNLKFSGILPTLIDCSSETVLIKRPGLISEVEVENSLPIGFKVEKDYSVGDINLKEFEIEANNQDQKLVFATKEKLTEVFNLHPLDYFQYKRLGNFTLVNLGSQTNPENILKNLYRNLFEAENFGIKEKLFLWQNSGYGKWTEILQYTLKSFDFPFFGAETLINLGFSPTLVIN